MLKATTLTFAAIATIAAAGAVGVVSMSKPATAQQAQTITQPFVHAVRRLTESQYRGIIATNFGPDIKLDARFEPELREEGLQAIGNAQVSVTTSGFEQYFALAAGVSSQVVDPKVRDKLACKPADPKAADAACTRQLVASIGKNLFRRDLSEAEIQTRLKIAAEGASKSKDYYDGLRLALASLLVDPEFLFRVEVAEPQPGKPGVYRLDAGSKASRLAFLMWDSAPDAELMAVAANGTIHDKAVLGQQIQRMLISPKLKDGARAFFNDMLQFENFESLNKDLAAYPKFSQKVADSAKEQTLRTLVDLLVDQDRDYRDVFTSNETFIDRALASVYNMPYRSKQPWAKVTFDPATERAGILTQVTFLSLYSHPAASSPTKRGVKIHEIFMCEPTPEPPADVDFSKVQALSNGTVRTRLLAHMENEGCAVCHRRSDPPGLALEHFDGLGQLRTLENGQRVDVSAAIDGKTFEGATGLGKYMRESPLVSACLVRNVFAYGAGHAPGIKDEDYLADQTTAFANDQFKYRKLLANIASSDWFYQVSPPAGLSLNTTPAAAKGGQ